MKPPPQLSEEVMEAFGEHLVHVDARQSAPSWRRF